MSHSTPALGQQHTSAFQQQQLVPPTILVQPPPIVRCFTHGQSNPTYFIKYGGKNMVLRKKPPGKLLPSAHAVEREYRAMKSVGPHGVPVPKMLGLCEDDSVIGTPFYVMEHVPGRIFQDALLKDHTPEERSQIYIEMIDDLILCALSPY